MLHYVGTWCLVLHKPSQLRKCLPHGSDVVKWLLKTAQQAMGGQPPLKLMISPCTLMVQSNQSEAVSKLCKKETVQCSSVNSSTAMGGKRRSCSAL